MIPGYGDGSTTPTGGTGFVNTFPGTDWAADTPAKVGVNTKDWWDGFNAMLWRQSGGKSGAPMPQPEPEDPRLAASRALNKSVMAGVNAGVVGAPGGGGMTGRFRGGLAGPVQSVLGGFNPAGVKLIQPGTTSTVRNPAAQARLGATLNDYSGAVGAAKTGSLTQFTKDFLDERTKQKAALGQEEDFIGKTFDPNGLEANLASIARNRSALGRQAAESAIRRAGRDASISRMVNGGDASYLNRAYADQLGRILLDNALKGSDMARENAMYVQGQRNAALGARRRLGMDYVNDAMLPFTTIAGAQATDLGNLGRIQDLENSNTLYDYVTPDQAASRNLGMLNDLETRYNRYRV